MGTPKRGDTILGKYRVERVLGRGGMGIVVSARHLQLDDRVAIKVLTPEAAEVPALVKRFLLEARASRRIKSEHIVQVTDVGTLETGEPFMVMEHLDGTDLSQLRRKQGPLEVEVAVEYVLQAIEALAEAHAQGIIHRDLKPANLFLTKRADGSPLVKVLDFGISKVLDPTWRDRDGQLTRTGVFLGSPPYMAPEQIAAAHEIDARTDIWALGVVLYSVLTGVLPFKAASETATLGLVLSTAPLPPSAIRPALPPELDGVILRCLEKSPDARFPNVSALAAALGPFAPPRARTSVDRIARVLGVPVVPPHSEAQPAASSGHRSTEPPPLSLRDVRAEVCIDVALQPGPNTLAFTGLSRTIERLKSAARATGVMAFVGIGCAISIGLIVFITVAPPPASTPATAGAPTARPTRAPATAAPSDRDAAGPIPLPTSAVETPSAITTGHEKDGSKAAAPAIKPPTTALPPKSAPPAAGASAPPKAPSGHGGRPGIPPGATTAPIIPTGKSTQQIPDGMD